MHSSAVSQQQQPARTQAISVLIRPGEPLTGRGLMRMARYRYVPGILGRALLRQSVTRRL